MAPARRLVALAAGGLAALQSAAAGGMDIAGMGLEQALGVSSMLDTFVKHPGHKKGEHPHFGKQCGLNGVLNEDTQEYEEPADKSQLECGKRMTTNCSVSYYPMQCPTACGYLVPNTAFSCLFECVHEDMCSSANPNRAFPNSRTHICEHCSIEGCKKCSSQTTCIDCHPHFHLSGDGKKCIFNLDHEMNWSMWVMVLGMLVGGLVLLGIVWFCWKGPHPNWKSNMVAIERARRHRHLTKVYNWQLDNKRSMRQYIGLAANMHKTNVLGVGVALFYNNIVFTGLVAFVFWICTYILFESSDVSKAMGKFEDATAYLLKSVMAPEKYQPAIILSPLAVCGHTSGSKTQGQIMGYARNNFIMIGILYVVTFVASLVFGLLQRRAATKFDEANSTMSDYALLITGLPEDATNESELKRWLETEFRKVCPGLWKRPSKTIHKLPPEKDTTEERHPTEIEVFGVSICYDYLDQAVEIDDIMWGEMEQMEIDMHREANYDTQWVLNEHNTMAAERGKTLRDVQKTNRKKVTDWFEGGSGTKLKATGEMFCVFKYLTDKYMVLRYMDQHPEWTPSYKGKPVRINHVHSEPNCVAWHFIGLPHVELVKKTVRNFLYILLCIALVQMFIIMPYAKFILLPYATTGSAAGGMKTTIAGIVLGNINGILFITNFMTAVQLGYARKDMMDVFVLFTNTILVLINTLFNIAITVIMVMSQTSAMGEVIEDVLDGKTLKAVGTENAVARNLYQMLMPGSFFMGLIMAMIMAGWVPFLVNTALMKVIYIWKCFPDCILKIFKTFLPWAPPGLDFYPFRSAEKAFEPWEVPVCGNYADQIVTPTICFGFLFFASPYTHKCFLGMFMWSVFEYFYFRYMHLRYHKTCWYTTSRLDSFSNYLWGLPLSVIAAAWCHWGFRSEYLGQDLPTGEKFALMTAIFLVSNLIWVVSYRFLVNPFNIVETDDEQQTVTVEELSQETVYTWFNCNAPFVLKCKYYFLDEDGQSIKSRRGDHPIACGEDPTQVRFFEVGKQGLFAKPERQKFVHKISYSLLEFETWFEYMLRVMDFICRNLRCGKEGQIAREASREAWKGGEQGSKREVEMRLLDDPEEQG